MGELRQNYPSSNLWQDPSKGGAPASKELTSYGILYAGSFSIKESEVDRDYRSSY